MSLKERIRSAQLKAAVAVNAEMILLYWDIGRNIVEKQESNNWGSKIVDQLAKDLKSELPDSNGFSRSNLFAMRKFYLFYKGRQFVHRLGGQITNSEIVQQPVGLLRQAEYQKQNNSFHASDLLDSNSLLAKIPWGHHIVILGKCKNEAEAGFYIQQTIVNNWSRNILQIQIESDLFNRQGKSINNFELTLPKAQSDLARETLKDPYKFDFLTLESDVQELELEKHLTDNITKLLLELGIVNCEK